jgi:Ca2+:H+ antiporter
MLYGLFLLFQLKTHTHLYTADNNNNGDHEAEEEAEEPSMLLPWAVGALVFVTVMVATSAECLVGSIEGVSASAGLSETFIGLILVPIVGNAAGK